jgi:hypothetical protein
VAHASGTRHARALGVVTVPVAGTVARQEAVAWWPTDDKVDCAGKRGSRGLAPCKVRGRWSLLSGIVMAGRRFHEEPVAFDGGNGDRQSAVT